MENVEQKLDAIARDVNDLKETVDSLAQSVARGFELVNERVDKVNDRMDRLVTSEELQRTKLDLFDRLATKTQVDDHELRLQEVEARI